MPQIHFDFEKILHNCKSTVSLMAEFTKTWKMWRGLRIASGSKCRIKILHEYGTFMYQSIFCASSVDIYIEFFCYEYLWDLKLSLVYMHNAGLMSRQTTEQRGNSLFKPPIYWGRPTFSFIVMKLGKCKLKRSRSKIDKMQNIQLRSVANRVMTFPAKQLAIFISPAQIVSAIMLRIWCYYGS